MEEKGRRYCTLFSSNNPDDIEFLDDQLEERKNRVAGSDPTEMLLTLANLNSDNSISKIKGILEKNTQLSNLNDYMEAIRSSMQEYFGCAVADLIMLDWQEGIECTSIEETKDLFVSAATRGFSLASQFCNVISSDFQNGHDGSTPAVIISAISSSMPLNILYRPLPALLKSTNEIVYCDSFSTDSTIDALYLCFVLTVREKKQIRCCEVCKEYFIPVAKSNEIYCINCRKTTYDTKIKKDAVLSAYRTIYKTQNARKQRNLHRPHIITKFERWKENAKLMLKRCQNQEITIEEMSKAISSDSWIYEDC